MLQWLKKSRMAIQEDKSLSSPQFFKIILAETIQDRTQLKLPSKFVKEHGKSLSNFACLQVPTGALTWQVGVERRGRRVWLHTGWKDFVDYYAIKCGYLLMFRYEGKSRFRVFVFDTTTLEIQYPVGAASTSRSRVKLDRSKVIKIKEEDTDTDDDEEEEEEGDNDNPHKPREVARTRQSSRLKTRHVASAADKVLQRANTFKSQNPFFIVEMKPFHVSDDGKSRLNIPERHSRTYFHENGNNGIYLNVEEDRRAWFVKYSIVRPPWLRAYLRSSGWRIFVKENHLQLGDTCVFELVNRTALEYKVTIFRIADYA